MTNWDEAERIYAKLCNEGDITWKESDVIFKILHDRIFSKTLNSEDYNKSKEFLNKWYTLVLNLVECGKKGIFLHSILHHLKDRHFKGVYKKAFAGEMLLTDYIEKSIRGQNLLEEKDEVVILTFRNRDDVSKFLNKKIPRSLAGTKYQRFENMFSDKVINYGKYFFEIYRPMTLSRVGFNDYIKLDIDDDFFKIACADYGRNSIVTDMSCVYERAIEIMLDMNILIYAFSTVPYSPHHEIQRAKFNMFVHKDYAEEVSMIFNILPHAVDESFFNLGVSAIQKYDAGFTDFITDIIKNHMYRKEKQRLLEDDDWMEIER